MIALFKILDDIRTVIMDNRNLHLDARTADFVKDLIDMKISFRENGCSDDVLDGYIGYVKNPFSVMGRDAVRKTVINILAWNRIISKLRCDTLDEIGSQYGAIAKIQLGKLQYSYDVRIEASDAVPVSDEEQDLINVARAVCQLYNREYDDVEYIQNALLGTPYVLDGKSPRASILPRYKARGLYLTVTVYPEVGSKTNSAEVVLQEEDDLDINAAIIRFLTSVMLSNASANVGVRIKLFTVGRRIALFDYYGSNSPREGIDIHFANRQL